jgi:hypothetical protein
MKKIIFFLLLSVFVININAQKPFRKQIILEQQLGKHHYFGDLQL